MTQIIKYPSTLLGLALAISLSFFQVSAVSLTTQQTSTKGSSTLLPSLSPMIKKVIPSVVNVKAQGDVKALLAAKKPISKLYLVNKEFEHAGSGVVVDAKGGYLLTNAHVVAGSSTITITTHEGRQHKAKLIGADLATDIAVLQVENKKLMDATLGNSDKLEVGDFTAVIGNPFSLNLFGTRQSVSFGIISALQRSKLSEGYQDFIQTDAAVNLGASGGGLFNMKGELIGINSSLITTAGGKSGNLGVSFAIPINMAKSIMAQLIQHGSIHRGLMGVRVQQLTPELADSFNITGKQGALVTDVQSNSPADNAGLKPGDIITSLNGSPITESAQVETKAALLRVGSDVKIEVLREGKIKQLTTTISDPKKQLELKQENDPYLFGLELMNFNHATANHGQVKGVQILNMSENSASKRAELYPGDVIVEVDGKNTPDMDALLNALKGNNSKAVRLRVIRGVGALYLVMLR